MKQEKNEDLKRKSRLMIGLFSFLGIAMIASIAITSFTGKGTYSFTGTKSGILEATAKMYTSKGWDCQKRNDSELWDCTCENLDPIDSGNCLRPIVTTEPSVSPSTSPSVSPSTSPTPTPEPTPTEKTDPEGTPTPEASPSSTPINYCEQIYDQATCSMYGCHYYDDECHSTPKATPSPTPTPNCAPGKYASIDGSCKDCPQGYYCVGGSQGVTRCPTGKTSSGNAKKESDCYDKSCIEDNKYKNGANCYSCSAGTHLKSTYNECYGTESDCCEDDDQSDSLPKTVTLTFMDYKGEVTIGTRTCTIEAGATLCTGGDSVNGDLIAPTVTDADFNGWGLKKECKTGTYTNNASFRISRSSTNKTYFACKSENTEEKDSDFNSSKCEYSSETTVTRDEEYKNKCTYVNIQYKRDPNNATGDNAGNIHACCTARGGIWVGRNFTSSGYGYEYCVFCKNDGNPPGDPTDPTDPTNPTNPTNPPSGETQTCYVCVSGEKSQYVRASSSANAAQAATTLSGITAANCATTSESNCTGLPVTNCYECNGSKKHVMAESDADAKSESGGTSCTIVTTDKCNEITPPKTGTFGIIVAWVVGMMTIGYAMWYYKKSSSLS